ncbi:MAG: ATP-binding cassette domain-containing protein [Bacteroidetes bacterium]|nr:MAG: ATP-binding cassette domain-containing protein [Bacteroidota bacterium]
MIEVKNLHKSFLDKKILNDVSYTFEKGKTNLIIGASGTGKSVLLKVIVGLVKPESGVVLYDGRNFTQGDSGLKTDIRREMGMLFQNSALFDSKNVEQNVMFPLELLAKMPKSEMLERVNVCLQRVGLEGSNKKMPSELSGGMKKRVGIARAIVLNPQYLFFDEPNSGLDPQTSVKIDELIAEITHEYQTTSVVVTHDMNSVMEIGERIVFMYKGLKLWEGSNKDILETEVKELQSFIFANHLLKHLQK